VLCETLLILELYGAVKFSFLFLSVALVVICFHESGHADLTVSISEEGNNVVVRSEGSVDTSDFVFFYNLYNPFGGGVLQPFETDNYDDVIVRMRNSRKTSSAAAPNGTTCAFA